MARPAKAKFSARPDRRPGGAGYRGLGIAAAHALSDGHEHFDALVKLLATGPPGDQAALASGMSPVKKFRPPKRRPASSSAPTNASTSLGDQDGKVDLELKRQELVVLPAERP